MGDEGEVRPVSCPRNPNSGRAPIAVPPPLPGFQSTKEAREPCSPPAHVGPLLRTEQSMLEVVSLPSDGGSLDGAALLARAGPQEDLSCGTVLHESLDKPCGGVSVQVARSGKENMLCPASEITPRVHKQRKAPVPSQEMISVSAMHAQLGALQEKLQLAESKCERLQAHQREMDLVAEMNHADLASQKSQQSQLQARLAEGKSEREAMEQRLEQAVAAALHSEESIQAQHHDMQALRARLQYLEAELFCKARDAALESERTEHLHAELQTMEVEASLRNANLSSMGARLGVAQERVARAEAEEVALQELWRNSEAACAEAEEQLVCIVCLDCPRDTLLDPCLHYGLCSSCARTVDRCPVCRARIRQRHRIVSV